MSFVARAATASNSLSAAPALGLVTMLHCVPSQCWVRVCAPYSDQPTAHTSFDATATTPLNMLLSTPTLGLTTKLHCTPSQWSVREYVTLLPNRAKPPTAQISSGATAATP